MALPPEVEAFFNQFANTPGGIPPEVAASFAPQVMSGQPITLAPVPTPPAASTTLSPTQIEHAAARDLAALQQQQLTAQMQGTVARSQGLDLERQRLGMREQELAARQALTERQAELIAAERDVSAATRAKLQAERELLALQEKHLNQRRAEEHAIQAAKGNVDDVIQLGRALAERGVLVQRAAVAGIAAPIEVKFPPGYTGPIPPGVVMRLQTLAEILSEVAEDKERLRKFEEEAAAIKSAHLGQEVDAARIRRGDIALDLQEAELAVSRLGYDIDRLGLRIAGVGLEAERADLAATAAAQAARQRELQMRQDILPPFPGAVFDDEAMEWVSEKEMERRSTERQATRTLQMELAVQDFLVDRITEDQLRARLTAPDGPNLTPNAAELLILRAKAEKAKTIPPVPPPPPRGRGVPGGVFGTDLITPEREMSGLAP